MTLSPGTKLGSYEILAAVGAGGMGEVYRARDLQLGRDVAIKMLPDDFARDAERVARFQREAQVLASLSHSNIAGIFDLQRSTGAPFLVLEFVEGETLAERVRRGPLPLDEAVEIAKQIADALEAAHAKGIVHRDLKPANIKIAPDGQVKVLDFGLAKMYEAELSASDLSRSPTMMSARTAGGVILGTVSYMSPEQARGRTVTKQTDIWAFGCVLFEMLTGRLAFSGDTVSDTIAKILKEEPDWSDLSTRVSPALSHIVKRCLEKETRRRYHDAGDIRFELDETEKAALVAVTPEPRQRSYRAVLVASVLILLAFAGGSLWQGSRRDDGPPRWTGTRLSGPEIAFGPRVSPDGTRLAFQALVDGMTQVAVMNPKSGNWRLLTRDRDAGWINGLSWSADGTKIYFDRYNGRPLGIYSVPVEGGEPRLLLENAHIPEALPDGDIVVSMVNAERQQQLFLFDPNTREPQPLDALSLNGSYRSFPTGKEIVFYGKPADPSSASSASRLHILDLTGKKSRAFGPEMNLESSGSFVSMAVNPMDRSVLVDRSNGDLHEIVAITHDGKSAEQVLLTLGQMNWMMDMTKDGSLYVAQYERPAQILRFRDTATTPDVVATFPANPAIFYVNALELPDQRFLVTGVFDGRRRLLVVKGAGESVPFLDIEEESSGPAAFAGPNRVAFLIGNPPEQSIAIASIKDGQMQQRHRIKTTQRIQSLAASSDGKTVFYSIDASIWSLEAASGELRKLGPGDEVTFDPSRKNLVVLLNDKEGPRLGRMSVSGGSVESIPALGDPQVSQGTAVRADGRISVAVGSRDSWFFGMGLLDPSTGVLRRVPLRYDGDITSSSWNANNEIVTVGFLMRSSIWRFQQRSP